MAIIDFANRFTDEGGGTAMGVFLDLSKVFDTVNHNILLNKLSYYGSKNGTRNWFSIHSKSCKQYVFVDGVN